MSTKNNHISEGWEVIMNDEAIRYYQQRQQKKTVDQPDTTWYRKWVGPFAMFDDKDFTKDMISSEVNVEQVYYDASGYVIVPQSALN